MRNQILLHKEQNILNIFLTFSRKEFNIHAQSAWRLEIVSEHKILNVHKLYEKIQE